MKILALVCVVCVCVGCNSPTEKELIHQQASKLAAGNQTISPKQWSAWVNDTQLNPQEYRKHVLHEVHALEAKYSLKSRTWSDQVILGK